MSMRTTWIDQLEHRAIEAAEAVDKDGGELMLKEVSQLSMAISAKRQADALERIAKALEEPAEAEHAAYSGPIEPGMRFIWEPDQPQSRCLLEVVRLEPHWADPTDVGVLCRTLQKPPMGGEKDRDYWNEESRFREACWQGPVQ